MLKYIENWTEKRLTCHRCGKTRSVKYYVDDKPCCNMCALLWRKKNVKEKHRETKA